MGVPSVVGSVEVLKRPSWAVGTVNGSGTGNAVAAVSLASVERNKATTSKRQMSESGGEAVGNTSPFGTRSSPGVISGPRSFPMDHAPSSNSNSPPMQSIMPLIQVALTEISIFLNNKKIILAE